MKTEDVIMENNRVEDFGDERRSPQRTTFVDCILSKLSAQGRFLIILFGLLTFSMICGFGLSISKNGNMSIAIQESQKLYSAYCPRSLVTDSTCYFTELHYGCNIKLCKTVGEISCIEEYFTLSEAEVIAFVVDSCVNYRERKNCHLIKNSTVHVFKPEQCECICKTFLT